MLKHNQYGTDQSQTRTIRWEEILIFSSQTVTSCSRLIRWMQVSGLSTVILHGMFLADSIRTSWRRLHWFQKSQRVQLHIPVCARLGMLSQPPERLIRLIRDCERWFWKFSNGVGGILIYKWHVSWIDMIEMVIYWMEWNDMSSETINEIELDTIIMMAIMSNTCPGTHFMTILWFSESSKPKMTIWMPQCVGRIADVSSRRGWRPHCAISSRVRHVFSFSFICNYTLISHSSIRDFQFVCYVTQLMLQLCKLIDTTMFSFCSIGEHFEGHLHGLCKFMHLCVRAETALYVSDSDWTSNDFESLMAVQLWGIVYPDVRS